MQNEPLHVPNNYPGMNMTAIEQAAFLRDDLGPAFRTAGIQDVSFRNPDGSLVLLVLNSAGGPITFNIAWNGKFAQYSLRKQSVATFVWNAK